MKKNCINQNAKCSQAKLLAVALLLTCITGLSPTSTHGQALRYGDFIHLRNAYSAGSYLEVCGASSCSVARGYNVVTNGTNTGRGHKEGTWRIESAGQKNVGDIVQVGDQVHLKNMYTGGQTYLEVCGGTDCSAASGYDVVTNNVKTGRGHNEGTWRIESSDRKGNGENLEIGDNVHFRNMYSSGTYMEVCGGSGCSPATGYNVVTNSVKTGRGHNEGTWKIEAANSASSVIITAQSNESIHSVAENYVTFSCSPKVSTQNNGCSNPGDNDVANSYRNLFAPACASHDICYSSPWRKGGVSGNKGQRMCDDAFLTDMRNVCKNTDFSLGFLGEAECLLAAEGFYIGVDGWGTKSYNSGQDWGTENCEVYGASVIPDAVITVRNEAGYVASFKVTYNHNGSQSYESGRFAVGQWKSITIPHEATDVSLVITADVLGSFDAITWSTATTVCYQTWGTIFRGGAEPCTK